MVVPSGEIADAGRGALGLGRAARSEVKLAATVASDLEPQLAEYGPSIPKFTKGRDGQRYFNLIGHGAERGISFTVGGIEASVSPLQLVERLQSGGVYVKGTPVRLVACKAAEWAQEFADFLGADVLASFGDVYLSSRKVRAPEGFVKFSPIK